MSFLPKDASLGASSWILNEGKKFETNLKNSSTQSVENFACLKTWWRQTSETKKGTGSKVNDQICKTHIVSDSVASTAEAKLKQSKRSLCSIKKKKIEKKV